MRTSPSTAFGACPHMSLMTAIPKYTVVPHTPHKKAMATIYGTTPSVSVYKAGRWPSPTALAPASWGGGLKSRGSATPPPEDPRIPVRATRRQRLQTGIGHQNRCKRI